MSEIEDLIRKLEPLTPPGWAGRKLQQYHVGRFNPTLRSMVDLEVRELARKHELDNQIVLYPPPMNGALPGEYNLGLWHYGNTPQGRFGLRSPDFIKHVGIFGATGSGKTTTATTLIRQLCEIGKPFLILDPKGTWQTIIKKPWASKVKILKLGWNYTFNPFKLLPGMEHSTLIAEIVEVFCASQYLGHGAKNLLLKSIDKARDNLTLRNVYLEFQNLDLRGYKMESWAKSTERALENASTGTLGKVLNSPENIPFEKLMDSQVVILMDELADEAQKAMFMGLMLNRIYWFRKLAGIREQFKHLLVLEEFHVLSKEENYIDQLIKMCREFSEGVMILDQNPGNISKNVLGNLNAIISMNLGTSTDISAVSTAMVLDTDTRKFLGKLPTGWAICRVKDRFPESVLVKIDQEIVEKVDISLADIREHNGDFIRIIPEPEPVERQEVAHVAQEVKLTQLQRKILRYLKINNSVNLKTVYLAHGLSYRRGNTIRNKLEFLGMVQYEKSSTETGHETILALTEKGIEYLHNTEDSRRLGGVWHRITVEKLVKYYTDMGYVVRREWKDIDIFVDMGSATLAIEVESLGGTKDIVHAVQNVLKSSRLADFVHVVVKDQKSKKRLQEAVKKSPVRNYQGLKLRVLEEYNF